MGHAQLAQAAEEDKILNALLADGGLQSSANSLWLRHRFFTMPELLSARLLLAVLFIGPIADRYCRSAAVLRGLGHRQQ